MSHNPKQAKLIAQTEGSTDELHAISFQVRRRLADLEKD
jgi:hypothetical protein